MVNPSESALIEMNSGTRSRGYIGRGVEGGNGMNRIAAIVASLLVTVAFGFTGVAAAGPSPVEDVSTASGEVDAASASATAYFAVESPVAVAAQETNDTDEDGEEQNETEDGAGGENETAETENESVAPGARLAGVLGAQQEELEGEVENRAFGHAVAAARSNGSKARLVANNTERLQERLQRLEDQLETLNESFDNGSIPRGVYYAKVTRLSARIQATERLINQTADTARALPPQARMAHGVNVTQLDHLRSQVRNVSGPAVAAIARQMAGQQVGHQMGPPRGPPNGTPGQGPPNGSHGPGQSGDQGQNSSGTMGPPGTNQSDSNRTAQGPPNGMSNSSNQSGQGQGGQGPPDDKNDNADSVDRPALSLDLGTADGVLAAIVRSIPGFGA